MCLSAMLGRNYSSLNSAESRIMLKSSVSDFMPKCLPECPILLSFISDKSKMHIAIFKTRYLVLHITIRDFMMKEKEPFIGPGSTHILT